MNIYFTLFTLAWVLSLVGYLWLAIVGFKRSVPWGLLVLLLSPITAIIFAMTNWFDARKPFLVYGVSLLLMIGSAFALYNQTGVLIQQTVQRVHSGELTQDEARQLIINAWLGHVAPPSAKAATEPTQGQALAASEVAQPNSVQKSGTQQGDTTGDKAKTADKAETADKSKTEATSEKAATKKGESDANASVEEKPEAQMPNPDQALPDPLAQKRKKPEPKTITVGLDKVSKYIGHYFIITLKTGNEQRGLLRKVDDKKLILERKLYGGNFQYRIRKDQIKAIHMLTRIPEER